jgi:hypothetical protein
MLGNAWILFLIIGLCFWGWSFYCNFKKPDLNLPYKQAKLKRYRKVLLLFWFGGCSILVGSGISRLLNAGTVVGLILFLFVFLLISYGMMYLQYILLRKNENIRKNFFGENTTDKNGTS